MNNDMSDKIKKSEKEILLERHASNALATLTVKLQMNLKASHLQSSFIQNDFFLLCQIIMKKNDINTATRMSIYEHAYIR